MKHLPWNKWCVVEVSMSPTNPIFRSVARSKGDGRYELFGHDEKIVVAADKLSFFDIIEEIRPMNRARPGLRMPPDCAEGFAHLRPKARALLSDREGEKQQ